MPWKKDKAEQDEGDPGWRHAVVTILSRMASMSLLGRVTFKQRLDRK